MSDINDQLNKFLEKYSSKTYKKGEIIIFQGEVPRSAFIVKKGIVKAYNLSVNGDEKPINFHSTGEVFPVSWIYGKISNAIYYYEALTSEVTIVLVNREEYINFLKSSPELLFDQLQHFVGEQLGSTMRLNALQHSRARDKLIYTLHYLTLSHGRYINPKTMEITLELTHQDFANLTGLTRETAATELNKLKNMGVITYSKSSPYKLHLDKLMTMLNDEYIADIKLKL